MEQLDGPDLAPLVAHFQSLQKQFPGVKKIAEAGRGHASGKVHDLTEAGKFDEALATAKQYQPLIGDAKEQAEMGGLVYCLWGQKLRSDKQWKESLAKYSEGRKLYPKDNRLEQGLTGTLDTWAKGFMDDNQWDEAIGIYNLGLTEYLPDSYHLKKNKEYCEAKKQGK